MKQISILLYCSFILNSCLAQITIDKYVGGWSGIFASSDWFKYELLLKQNSEGVYTIEFINSCGKTSITLKDMGIYYEGKINSNAEALLKFTDSQNPMLFFRVGDQKCHIRLKRLNENWEGDWSLLIYENFSPTLYLSLDRNQDQFYASTFFKEPSLHYMWAEKFEHQGKEIRFSDRYSSLSFKGSLEKEYIQLDLYFLHETRSIKLEKLEYNDWRRGQFDFPLEPQRDKKKVFKKLPEDINSDTLEGVHSVIINLNDSLIFEKYFDGFTQETPHDIRSVGKSIAGTILGIAIQEGLIPNEHQLIKPYIENDFPDIDWSKGKDSVSFYHLLTMSSGIDAIDFGLSRESYANEGNFNNAPNWTKHILEAPMVLPVGKEGNYGSGSPQLIGYILEHLVDYPLELYIQEKLFEPLGVNNYRLSITDEKSPYFAGGWYLSAQDLSTYAQLILNKGEHEGSRLISIEWIEKSIDRHVTLENTWDKNKYGYFFWHKTYKVNDREIASIEARGTGGQYVFIVPELRLTSVITSGNYYNNKGFQPERIFKDYILREILYKMEIKN